MALIRTSVSTPAPSSSSSSSQRDGVARTTKSITFGRWCPYYYYRSRAVRTLSALLLLGFLVSPLNILYSLGPLSEIMLQLQSQLSSQDVVYSEEYHPQPPPEIQYARMAFLEKKQEQLPSTANSTTIIYPPPLLYHQLHHFSVIPMSSKKQQMLLQDDEAYEKGRAEPFETPPDCVAQHAWQRGSFPTCNLIHTRDLTSFFRRNPQQQQQQQQEKGKPAEKRKKGIQTDEAARIVANGAWRDVWVLLGNNMEQEQPSHVVLKTLRWTRNVTEQTLDIHRVDAVAMERLTSSNYVMDIYGACGSSSIVEFATGPDISKALWPGVAEKDGKISRKQYEASSKLLTKLELLHIAVQATMGLAAFHNIDNAEKPSMIHNDIAPAQWIKIGNTYKLNDFNRARMLSWNPQTQEICPRYEFYNPAKAKRRSPEEYTPGPQTEKVDVYALGNVFYMLLMKQWPFKYYSRKEVAQAITKGERPYMFPDVQNSTDPIDRALLAAMEMCFPQNAAKRATARQVETFLKDKLRELDPGRLEAWGES